MFMHEISLKERKEVILNICTGRDSETAYAYVMIDNPSPLYLVVRIRRDNITK